MTHAEVPAALAPSATPGPTLQARSERITTLWSTGLESGRIPFCWGADRSPGEVISTNDVRTARVVEALYSPSGRFEAWKLVHSIKYSIELVKAVRCFGPEQSLVPAIAPELEAQLTAELDDLIAALDRDLFPPMYDSDTPIHDAAPPRWRNERSYLVNELIEIFESRFDPLDPGDEPQVRPPGELRKLVYAAALKPSDLDYGEPLRELVAALERDQGLAREKPPC